MKKLRATICRYFERLDECWRLLPIGKQHQYMLYFFVGYLLLTVGVVGKVCYDISGSHNDIGIEHIRNPVFEKK